MVHSGSIWSYMVSIWSKYCLIVILSVVGMIMGEYWAINGFSFWWFVAEVLKPWPIEIVDLPFKDGEFPVRKLSTFTGG